MINGLIHFLSTGPVLGDSGDTAVTKTSPSLPSQSSWSIAGVGEGDGRPISQIVMTQRGQAWNGDPKGGGCPAWDQGGLPGGGRGTSPGKKDRLCKGPYSGASLTHAVCLEEDGVCPVPAESTAPTSPFLTALLLMPSFRKCWQVPALCPVLCRWCRDTGIAKTTLGSCPHRYF